MAENSKNASGNDTEDWLQLSPGSSRPTSRDKTSGQEEKTPSQQGSRGNIQGTEGSSRPASTQSKKRSSAGTKRKQESGGVNETKVKGTDRPKSGTQANDTPRPASGKSARENTGADKTFPKSFYSLGKSERPSTQHDESKVMETPPEDKDNKQEKTGQKPKTPCSASSSDTELDLEPWPIQKTEHWPKTGKHILCQYNDDTVVVYQAFKESIADYAVENQTFGGKDFSLSRMSWIKTNFLWMMYRAGWATKRNQEHILAVTISREGWDEILSKAYTVVYQKKVNVETKDIEVRLQWDPDHNPTGGSVQRRAIQLGLKNEILQRYASEFIRGIEDITEFVKAQHLHVTEGSQMKLVTPRERVYTVADEAVAERIGVDTWQPEMVREESVLY